MGHDQPALKACPVTCELRELIMAVGPTYEAIPEGEGWLIVNLSTGEHAQFNGRPLVNLPFDLAEDIVGLLNKIEAVLVSVAPPADPPGQAAI
jgi:hypothetical protein